MTSLRLVEEDCRRIQDIYGARIGMSKIVRELIAAHLRQIDAAVPALTITEDQMHE